MTRRTGRNSAVLGALSVGLALVFSGGPARSDVVDLQSTVVVSPTGVPAVDGAALLEALAAISATADAPVLLKIEPGLYDVGGASLEMKPFVDIEGSGRNVTVIMGNVGGAFSAQLGVVTVVQNAELRILTVENLFNRGAVSDSAAIVVRSGGRVSDVSAVATGTGFLSRAILTTFFDGDAPAMLSNVTATASGRAVQVLSPGLEANNLVAKGAEGLFVSSGPVTVRNSVFRGTDFGVLVSNLSPAVNFVGTQVDGELLCSSGNCRCVNAYDGDFAPLASDCTPLPPDNKEAPPPARDR